MEIDIVALSEISRREKGYLTEIHVDACDIVAYSVPSSLELPLVAGFAEKLKRGSVVKVEGTIWSKPKSIGVYSLVFTRPGSRPGLVRRIGVDVFVNKIVALSHKEAAEWKIDQRLAPDGPLVEEDQPAESLP